MRIHTGVRLLQSLRALKHKHPLGLIIMGRRGIMGRFQYRSQLFRLHGPVTELAQGIAGRTEGCKIHWDALLFH